MRTRKYSGADDPDIPDNVPEDDKAQFAAAWNSAWDSCQAGDVTPEDGGDCEGYAFATAYAAINREIPRSIKEVDSWSGAASNYSDTEAYCNACLINANPAAGKSDPEDWTQANCMLPVREEGDGADTYVDKAVHAAAGGHGITQVQKPSDVSEDDWDSLKKTAANKIISAYNQMDETAPDAVYEIAGKEPPSRMRRFLDRMKAVFEEFFAPKTRAVSIESIWQQAMSQAEEIDYWAWPDLYMDDDGGIFAAIASNGKMFRSPITVDTASGDIEMGEWQEVLPDFRPAQRSALRVWRQKDGRYRWLGVSCSAVLDRVAEIDSRALFDSFVAHAEETGEYPVRMFYHLGERMRTGQADYLARDGYLYVTSGLYDETELGEMEAKARMNNPEYWGDSIGYDPTSPAELLEIADGIKIPVYNSGVNREISTLPEEDAAAWFTNSTKVMEVKRMITGKARDALLKLYLDGGGTEEDFEAYLANNEELNRSIESDPAIIARQGGEPGKEPASPDPEPATEPASPLAGQEIVLDDAAVATLVARLGESEPFTKMGEGLDALTRSVGGLKDGVDGKIGDVQKAVDDLAARVEKLEATDEEKRQRWLDDSPGPSPEPVTVTYRPRQALENHKPPEEETSSDKAAKVLEGLPKAGY